MAWPRSDVRRQRPWRGSKLRQKPKSARSIRGPQPRGRSDGSATRGRTHMSEHVDWRFDEYRRRSSGLVLRAWPRPDVRRRRPRRGSKHQAKAQGRPFHPGATGGRQIGRVKNLNLWLMSRYGQLRRWDAVAEYKDWPLRSGRRRLGSPPSREEHRCPRGTGGTHPGRSSCVRNAVTPSRSGLWPGKPTVRRAQSLGGNLMIEKRNAPRGALLYPRRSREELEGKFLGPMTYPDPKGERNNSMSESDGHTQVSGVRRRGTRVIWRKLDLPESQSPEDETRRPSERHMLPAPRSATASFAGCRNLRNVERCPVRAIKEMSGAPRAHE